MTFLTTAVAKEMSYAGACSGRRCSALRWCCLCFIMVKRPVEDRVLKKGNKE